ncbi:MAG: DNA-binding protein WhiA [Firmicutes bacterium]|nr:DNA-binding protein WhiA [Bacillota bacterium]
MTFTTTLKEEIAKQDISIIEVHWELVAFLRSTAKFKNNEMTITLENAAVARKIYKAIKMVFDIKPNIVIRIQKRFKVKQIYILIIKEKISYIKETLKIGNKIDIEMLASEEEKLAFVKGSFLAVGNISDPKTSGYHLEFIYSDLKIAKQLLMILKSFKFKAKLIKRGYKNVVYLKSSENISDLIKMFGATNSLFYFEDIRIYRDHKNMVNRLNNCEIANQEKTFKTGQKQLENIMYLKNNNLLNLLDEKTLIVALTREKYPELSYQELADIISSEEDYKIGKSGVNHHFIKIAKLVENYRKKE